MLIRTFIEFKDINYISMLNFPYFNKLVVIENFKNLNEEKCVFSLHDLVVIQQVFFTNIKVAVSQKEYKTHHSCSK